MDYLDRLADAKAHRLRHLSREGFIEDREWLETLERWGFAFDPGRPAFEEMVHAALARDGGQARDVASPAGG